MSFSQLGLSEKVLAAIQAAGYTTPTPIQDQAIPHVLARRDVLGIAQTGTGKTAAFTLPMLTMLEKGRARARMPRTLILEPTRELAAQVEESFAKYGYFTNFEGNIVFGVGDQLFGPVHSNDTITVHSTGATFHGMVTTAGIVVDPGYGDFRVGYEDSGRAIPFPATADLNKLKGYAQTGSMAFTADSTTGTAGQAALRFEFMNIDLNGDGDTGDRIVQMRDGRLGDPTSARARIELDVPWRERATA